MIFVLVLFLHYAQSYHDIPAVQHIQINCFIRKSMITIFI